MLALYSFLSSRIHGQFPAMETRSDNLESDAPHVHSWKHINNIVTGVSAGRLTPQREEQSSPRKAHSKQPSRSEAEGVTPETSSRCGRDKQRSKATHFEGGNFEGGSGPGPENQMDDVAALRRENKRLREENALLMTEVDSWRAKAKERHAKCIALKAVIKAVENRLDEPTEGGEVAEIDEAEDKSPKRKEVTKEPDFTRATITWEERDSPKSRFDESMRPRIVMLPFAQQQALPSFSQSTRKPEPIIFPSPLKGSVRRDRPASPIKQLQITAAARSPSPTKPLSSPTKPRWM